MKNEEKIKTQIKKYFNDVKKEAEKAFSRKDYGLAHLLLENEFTNPLIDLATLEDFKNFDKEIIKEIELNTIDENESNLKKEDYYIKIFNQDKHIVNGSMLDLFIVKYINELNDVDFAFLNMILKSKKVGMQDKMHVVELIATNNLVFDLQLYNQYLEQSMKIEIAKYNRGGTDNVNIITDPKIYQINEQLDNHFHQNPSFLNLSKELLYLYYTYFFPFDTAYDVSNVTNAIIKYINECMHIEQKNYTKEEKKIINIIGKMYNELE
ncbi:DUF3196 family protein [Ureaplasma canigenitalium]|uniref:DUF3196 family protein n=1 Tax=Ureaplasma canigenitalium TaxID=42092 RepID=UPI0004E1D0DD|nr:DUF3196 family protein [Ureaplasma canigenitalium]